MAKKFALYFSHSWRPEDVDLNLGTWKLIAERCNLLVDLPDSNQPNPPYIINRLEELLRRSDLFLAVLPYRDPENAGSIRSIAREDASLRCPPGILFEIRLAERADRPRLILFDNRTGFKPPRYQPTHAKYIGRNFSELRDYLPEIQPQLSQEIDSWLSWANYALIPRDYNASLESLVLLPNDIPFRDEALEQIRQALARANFGDPVNLGNSFTSDAELFRLLTGGGLLVADISTTDSLGVYCIAHALFIPSVRLLHQLDSATDMDKLPWVLRGHPGGYQFDIVRWREPHQLGEAVTAHAEAMLAAAKTIINYEDGRRLFESRRYANHRVFISHNLPRGGRELVDFIVAGLRGVSVNCWEYDTENRAGEDWEKKMTEELKKATHFLVLFTPTYEQSEACVKEIEWALDNLHPEKILPFLVGGRTSPHVKLKPEHHQFLDKEPKANAATVVQRVIEVLQASQ